MNKNKKTRLMIERLVRTDIPRLLEIEKISYPDPWTEEMFREEAMLHPYKYPFGGWIRETSDDLPVLVGFCLSHLLKIEGRIYNIAVHPDYRGRGYGRSLLAATLNLAREKEIPRVVLEVRESNTTAQALYKSLGFGTAGRRKKYYEVGREDALVMVLQGNYGPYTVDYAMG